MENHEYLQVTPKTTVIVTEAMRREMRRYRRMRLFWLLRQIGLTAVGAALGVVLGVAVVGGIVALIILSQKLR